MSYQPSKPRGEEKGGERKEGKRTILTAERAQARVGMNFLPPGMGREKKKRGKRKLEVLEAENPGVDCYLKIMRDQIERRRR